MWLPPPEKFYTSWKKSADAHAPDSLMYMIHKLQQDLPHSIFIFQMLPGLLLPEPSREHQGCRQVL
jgi:hypothetical protein